MAEHAHRWITLNGSLFDLVPAGTHLGGSGNPLDQVAVETAVSITLSSPTGRTTIIRHADAPTFIALKWAAYTDRGDGDLIGSHDVEDILAVLASRPSLRSECAQSSDRVRVIVRTMTDVLLEREDRFGRTLAYLHTTRGTLVNEALVRQGYAVPLLYAPTLAKGARREITSPRTSKGARWGPFCIGRRLGCAPLLPYAWRRPPTVLAAWYP